MPAPNSSKRAEKNERKNEDGEEKRANDSGATQLIELVFTSLLVSLALLG